MLIVIAFSGSARATEIARDEDRAHRDDQQVEQRRMLEPGSGRNRARSGLRRRRASLALAEIDAEHRRGLRFRRRRRRQPHHQHDDDDLDEDRDEALPEEDRVAERNHAAGHEAAGGDDVANLRLQRARRRHLQRRGSAEALRPDAADAEHARRRERAIVDAFDAPRHFARQHRAEDQAEAPVEPRRREREERDERHRAARRARPAGDRANRLPHRRRCRQHVAGDDDQRHLQRERDQVPEAVAPRIDDLKR